MKLTFYGGAKTVTGSNYLLETEGFKALVDCGLFQGRHHVEKKNYEPLPYKPQEVDYLFLTHAHIDHSGRIPYLYKEGFRGKIFTTPATKELSFLMLEDSLKIHRQEAQSLGIKPLYTEKELKKAFTLFEAVEYEEDVLLKQGFKFRLREAGHILGSAVVELVLKDKKIVFSGDLGNPPVPLLRPPAKIKDAQYAVVESAYGDRIHEDKMKRQEILEDTIEDTITKKGVLLIPAFALERTQELLYELNDLVEHHRIPQVPIFIDSPLAIQALEIYKKYEHYYNKEATYLIASGDELFRFPGLKFTESVEESKKINNVPPPKVIIAGSGMSTGGRILYHEIRYLPDPKSLLLFISFQAQGTLGREIFEGAKVVKIFGQSVKVKAQTKAIGGYSAHADSEELLSWVRNSKKTLQKVFVVQGEQKPALALAHRIQDQLGIEAEVPSLGDSFRL